MYSAQEATAILREKGFKVTPQRLAVYDALSATREHPNAEAIYRELRPKFPTMSLATVYKSLDVLCQAGLAQVLNAGEDSFRYDANTSCHPHVLCTACGRVEDVPAVDDAPLAAEIAARTRYELTGRQLYFYGICPACKKKELH